MVSECRPAGVAGPGTCSYLAVALARVRVCCPSTSANPISRPLRQDLFQYFGMDVDRCRSKRQLEAALRADASGGDVTPVRKVRKTNSVTPPAPRKGILGKPRDQGSTQLIRLPPAESAHKPEVEEHVAEAEPAKPRKRKVQLQSKRDMPVLKTKQYLANCGVTWRRTHLECSTIPGSWLCEHADGKYNTGFVQLQERLVEELDIQCKACQTILDKCGVELQDLKAFLLADVPETRIKPVQAAAAEQVVVAEDGDVMRGLH